MASLSTLPRFLTPEVPPVDAVHATPVEGKQAWLLRFSLGSDNSRDCSHCTLEKLPICACCTRYWGITFALNRLKTVSPDKPLVVGSYAYLDGELHVRVSLAMDSIVKGLTESREKIMVSPSVVKHVLFKPLRPSLRTCVIKITISAGLALRLV